MTHAQLNELARRFLDAWNSQQVEAVVACYTPDVAYRDPNTRGEVRGSEALRHYLGKLFSRWQMRWTLREGFPLLEAEGAGVLWTASFRTAGGTSTVTADGMDLVLLRDGLIARNEVYFDRAVLAPLVAEA